MILPIYSYGQPILKKECDDIEAGKIDLSPLIENMWETLYNANGCGLAAPQIGQPIRLFLVDSIGTYQGMSEEDRAHFFPDGDQGIKQVFINAAIIDQSEEEWEDEEGCLSIPHLTGMVKRPWKITIEYQDADFNWHTKTFSGSTARMIQHEYDHTDGILYLDYLGPLKKRMMQKKLGKISKGQLSAKYPMKFKSSR